RMNSGGAHLVLDVTPDMAVFSKAIGNGYPIAAVIGKAGVMEAAQSTFISSTCWTERVGPTAAIATINKHRRVNAGEHLVTIGKQVQAGWRQLAEKYNLPIHVSGIPPLSHFAFKAENAMALKALFVQLMLEQGFLASTSFYSMLPHTAEHVGAYLRATDIAFAEMADRQSRGEVEAGLVGEPAVAGFKRLV
ncbi:MAG: aminotransferase class III-fold pyridoxal phosphate-dependent enzyme, partial [Candidatus Zixiibacteriota bacterium]